MAGCVAKEPGATYPKLLLKSIALINLLHFYLLYIYYTCLLLNSKDAGTDPQWGYQLKIVKTTKP